MTRQASEPTLRTLHRLREQGRLTAEETVSVAQEQLRLRQVELKQARERLSQLTVAERRGEASVKAGALQRRQACAVALTTARSTAALVVKRAIEAVAESQRELSAAEQAWRDARGQERVVERTLSLREMEAKRIEQRVEDDDNDDLAQRR